MVCWLYLFYSLVVLAVLGVLLLILKPSRKRIDLNGKHVLITGGSSGIGKCCAIELAKRGVAGITLFARDVEKLQHSKGDIESAFLDKNVQRVEIISVDLSKRYTDVQKAVVQAEEELGPISIVLNCAGFSIASKIEDIEIDAVMRLMDVNYKASFFVTRAVISSMKARGAAGEPGSIVFTSSEAGLIGIYGFTAYSASKFALRGLAEALQMEVKPYNISVTLAVPPDTDTPGFAEEEKDKPIETQTISKSSGLVQPKVVAKAMIDDMVVGKFFSSVGFNGKVLTTLCTGMSPVTALKDLLIQVVLMGTLRLIAAFLLCRYNRIVVDCMNAKKREKKST